MNYKIAIITLEYPYGGIKKSMETIEQISEEVKDLEIPYIVAYSPKTYSIIIEIPEQYVKDKSRKWDEYRIAYYYMPDVAIGRLYVNAPYRYDIEDILQSVGIELMLGG